MKVRGLWGLEIEPERATQVKVDGSFKITMASVSSFNGPERTSVYMEFQDKRFLLCSLIPEKIEQQVVDITCLKGEQITFRSVGPNGVHLMGNYISQDDSDNESEEEDSDSESLEDKEVEGILEKKEIESTFDDSDEYEDTPEIEEVNPDEEFDVSYLCHYLDTAFGFEEIPYNTVDRSNSTSDQSRSGSTNVDVIETSKKTTNNPSSKTPTPVKQVKQQVSKQQVVEKTNTECSKPQESKSKKTVSKRSTEVPVVKGPRPKRISRSEARKLLEQQQQQQQQQTSEPVITEANETEPSNNETAPKNTKNDSVLNQSIVDKDNKKTSKPVARITKLRSSVAEIPNIPRTRSKSPVVTGSKRPATNNIIATRTRSKSPLAKNTLPPPSSVNNQVSGQDNQPVTRKSKRPRAKKAIRPELVEVHVEETPVNQETLPIKVEETVLENTRSKKKSSKSKNAANNKLIDEVPVESIETITNEGKSKNSKPKEGNKITEETENNLSSELEERVKNASIKKKKSKPKKVKTPVEPFPDTVNQVEEEITSQESTDIESPISKKRKKSQFKKNQSTQPVQEKEEEEVNGPDHQEEEPSKTDTPKKIGSKKPNAPNKEEAINLETEVETKTNEERKHEHRSSESNEEVEDRSKKRFKLGEGLEMKMEDISHFTFEELLELEKERKRQKKERKKRKKEAKLKKENQSVTESVAPASTPNIVTTIHADAIAAAADTITTAARAVTTNTKKSIHAVNNKNIENLKKYPKRKASGQAAEKLGVMARADALMAQSVKRGELKRKKTKTSNLS